MQSGDRYPDILSLHEITVYCPLLSQNAYKWNRAVDISNEYDFLTRIISARKSLVSNPSAKESYKIIESLLFWTIKGHLLASKIISDTLFNISYSHIYYKDPVYYYLVFNYNGGQTYP